MATTVTVKLGGKDYPLVPASIKRSKAWRKHFQEKFDMLADTFKQVANREVTDIASITRLFDVIRDVGLNSTDHIVDLLFEYAPNLQNDRPIIEEHATDEEAVAAFMEVLKLAYPFGGLVTLVRSGLAVAQTSKNSASPNGGSSEKTPTPTTSPNS